MSIQFGQELPFLFPTTTGSVSLTNSLLTIVDPRTYALRSPVDSCAENLEPGMGSTAVAILVSLKDFAACRVHLLRLVLAWIMSGKGTASRLSRNQFKQVYVTFIVHRFPTGAPPIRHIRSDTLVNAISSRIAVALSAEIQLKK